MKTIRELINLIETAQAPVDRTVRVLPDVGEIGIDSNASPGNGSWYVKLYDGSYDVVGFNSEAEAWRELSSLQDLDTGDTKEQEVDDDVEHLANVAADAYWSGKFGMTSATEKVKMARDIVQAVEDGRLSIEELRQDIRDLDNKGVAEGTNGWVVYNIRGRIIKNFADEAEARQYAKQYGFYVKPQGVAEAISKNDLLNRLQKDLPRVDDPKNKDAEPVKWTGPGKDDYGYTGYQGHGMPTDKQERARIRADKKKQQDK